MKQIQKPKAGTKFTKIVEILTNTKPITNKELIKKNKQQKKT
jgi:hypothetical protein